MQQQYSVQYQLLTAVAGLDVGAGAVFLFFLKRDPRLPGTVLLEAKVEDEVAKEEADDDVAATKEGVRA